MSLILKNNVEKYNRIYKEGHNHKYPNLNLVRIFNTYFLKKAGKLLDFGFGTGENSIFLSNSGYKVYSLEASREAINIIKKKNTLLKKKLRVFHFINSKKIPFKSNFFDVVLCSSVISLLGNKKNIQDLVNEFSRILKKGGHLVIDINGPKGGFFKNAIVKKKNHTFYVLKKKQNSKIKVFHCKSVKDFLIFFKKFEIKDVGEIYYKYLDICDHEFLAILKKK